MYHKNSGLTNFFLVNFLSKRDFTNFNENVHVMIGFSEKFVKLSDKNYNAGLKKSS